MPKFIYKIYEVTDDYPHKKQLLFDVIEADDRNNFKDIIKSVYSDYNDIKFTYSKKSNVGDLCCVIISEQCYDFDQRVTKYKFTCDCCGTEVESFHQKPFNYSSKDLVEADNVNLSILKFCSYECKNSHLIKYKTENNVLTGFVSHEDNEFNPYNIKGYIYLITKIETGEMYVGKSIYLPHFRWCQHLKTNRFPISDITNYRFETLKVVTNDDEDIMIIEKKYILDYCNKYPKLMLNVMHNKKE